jgi:hypothetical protein
VEELSGSTRADLIVKGIRFLDWKVRADGIIPSAQTESAVIGAALGKAGVAE